MKKVVILIVLAAAIIWIDGLFLGQQPDKRNYVVFPNMYESAAYETQSPNPNFPDGKTEQPPVPGTIPWNEMPLHYTATDSGAVRAGKELHMPFDSLTAQDLERGRTVFGNFCTPCHGTGGEGDGPVAQHGYPPPPSLLQANAVNLPDGRIFHILTYGQKNMPGYARQISRTDRWKTVAFVRQLQRQSPQVQNQ